MPTQQWDDAAAPQEQAHRAQAVPLRERLISVPADAVLRIDTPNALGFNTRSIPVGALCHEAARSVSAPPAAPPQPVAQGPAQAGGLILERQLDRLQHACHERGSAIQRQDTDRAGQWLTIIDEVRAELRAVEFGHHQAWKGWQARSQAEDALPLMQQVLDALEIGRDAKYAEAQNYHEAMAGYRPLRHEQEDAEVAQIDAAITALRTEIAKGSAVPCGVKEGGNG